jgi:hypothetical protein
MADPYIPFGFGPPRLGPQSRMPMPAGPPLQSILDLLYASQPFEAAGPQSPEEAADLQSQGQSAINMTQMAAPFALGPAVSAGSRLAAAGVQMYPRIATALAGGSALVGESTAAGPPQKGKPQPKVPNPKPSAQPTVPAEGADPALQRLLESDTVLRRLQTQIDEQEAIANAPARDYPMSARNGARTRATDLQKDYNARLMELSRANLPFDQAYPWLAQNRVATGFFGPMLFGWGTRGAMNLVDRAMTSPWRRALSQADRALERGNERAYQHYMGRAARWEPGEPGMIGRAVHAGLPAAAGTGVGLELAHAPYAHNLQNAPLGSPQRKEAEDIMGNPQAIGSRLALGAFGGFLGGLSGSHLPNIPPGFRPPAPRPPSGSAGLPPAPLPIGGAGIPPASQTTAALPSPATPSVPPPTGTGLGAIWPAPPSVPNPPPPGLATLGGLRPAQVLPPETPPPVPSQVGAPPRPMPQGAFQARNGRWMVMTPRGPRFISDP